MVCSTPSSKMWKSFCERSRTNSPLGSVTVTGAITSFVATRIWEFAEGEVDWVWLRGDPTKAAPKISASAHRNISLARRLSTDAYAIQFATKGLLTNGLSGPTSRMRLGCTSRNSSLRDGVAGLLDHSVRGHGRLREDGFSAWRQHGNFVDLHETA